MSFSYADAQETCDRSSGCSSKWQNNKVFIKQDWFYIFLFNSGLNFILTAIFIFLWALVCFHTHMLQLWSLGLWCGALCPRVLTKIEVGLCVCWLAGSHGFSAALMSGCSFCRSVCFLLISSFVCCWDSPVAVETDAPPDSQLHTQRRVGSGTRPVWQRHTTRLCNFMTEMFSCMSLQRTSEVASALQYNVKRSSTFD